MEAQASDLAGRLFSGVLAPLVLGGPVRPGRPLGGRAAVALAQSAALDPQALEAVQRVRLRRARHLAAVDEVAAPSPPEWMLGAALHDVLQSANPGLDTPLRRRFAARLLDVAEATIDIVGAPAHAADALSRHTWFARVLDVTRTETLVSWWVGSRRFLGVEPPRRLQVWPSLRRVNVTRTPQALMTTMTPAGVAPDRAPQVIQKFLASTPLTDLATCARTAPTFAWTASTAGLVATRAGRTLALRVLDRSPAEDVDAALGRATRDILERCPELASPILSILSDRALSLAVGRAPAPAAAPTTTHSAAELARALGAAIAARRLATEADRWPEDERQRALSKLEPTAKDGEAILAALRM